MNIIEDLKLIIEDAGEAYEYKHNLKVVSVSALESLIEEYKNAQEPVCFARPDDVDMKTYPDLAFNSPVRSKKGGEFTQPLFTHPPLSDETVKDAAIGKMVREKMKSGNDVPVSRCTITRTEFDEAMKAANAETQATKG